MKLNIQTETDTDSSISINNETIDENNISEEISYYHNSAELIDNKCDDDGNIFLILRRNRMSHQLIIPIQLIQFI